MLNLKNNNGYLALAGRMGGKNTTVGLKLKAGAPEPEVMRALATKLGERRDLWEHLSPGLLRSLKGALSTDDTLIELANDPLVKMWSDALVLYADKLAGDVPASSSYYMDKVDVYLRSLSGGHSGIVDIPLSKMDSAFWQGFIQYFFKEPVLDGSGRIKSDRYGRPQYRWKVSGSTVRRSMSAIMAAMRLAEAKGWVVMPTYDIPESGHKDIAAAVKDQFTAIVAEAEADPAYHFMLPVLFMHYYTGARPAEIVRLVWSRQEVGKADLGRCYIDRSTDPWTITLASKLHRKQSADKTTRTLNVHPMLQGILERFSHGYAGRVCRNQDGGQFHYGYDEGKRYGGPYSKPFRTLATRAGLPKEITPYSFRHGFATRLRDTGQVDLLALKRAMGHTTIRTTERYVHMDVAGAKDVTALL